MEIQLFQVTVAELNEPHSHKPHLMCRTCKGNKNIAFSKKHFFFFLKRKHGRTKPMAAIFIYFFFPFVFLFPFLRCKSGDSVLWRVLNIQGLINKK